MPWRNVQVGLGGHFGRLRSGLRSFRRFCSRFVAVLGWISFDRFHYVRWRLERRLTCGEGVLVGPFAVAHDLELGHLHLGEDGHGAGSVHPVVADLARREADCQCGKTHKETRLKSAAQTTPSNLLPTQKKVDLNTTLILSEIELVSRKIWNPVQSRQIPRT